MWYDEIDVFIWPQAHFRSDDAHTASLASILFYYISTSCLTRTFSMAALFSHGRIICWGWNGNGILGTDNTISVGSNSVGLETVSFISFSDTLPALQITGSSHACAIFVNRRVRCWGANGNAQAGDTTTTSRGRGAGDVSITSTVFVTFALTINTIPVVAISAGQ